MVESNIRRGTVKLERQKYTRITFRDDQKVIERTVLQRVHSANSEFNFDDYESLMLDGMLVPEIQPSDQLFLQSFTKLLQLSLNACGLRSLANFPRIPGLIKIEL